MMITALAIKRRIATSVIAIALVVLGLFSLAQLPVNFLPDVTYPMIRVHVWWRGATPAEIETNLATPIERQMASVDGLDFLESSCIEGMYTLVVNFKYGVNADVAYQDALAAMARAARQLPKDIDPPIVIKADPSQLPVAQVTVRSEQWDMVRLRTWADTWLQEQLLAVPGVAGTEIVGGLKREIRIHIDPQAMEKYSLPLSLVIRRLQEENLEQFGGRVTAGRKEVIARTLGEFRSMEDIRGIVLARNGEANVTLGDVAHVLDAHEEQRVITRLDGQPALKLSVLKQADANTVEVAQEVGRRLQELLPSLPEGLSLGLVESQADYVLPALQGVRNAAVEAAILVFVVVYLFLGSWRQVAVMLVALPVALVCNFALMRLAGFSLNIFSLGGLVVAIGVVLDNSIVVIENITRLHHEQPELPMDALAAEGTAGVGAAILAATLSFLALFAPFLLVPGLTSLLFKELILVVAGIVCISLGVAITLTPMLAAWLLGSARAAHHGASRFERAFERVAQGYGRLLARALRLRWAVIGVFCFVLALAAILAPRLGGEFLPQMDDGRVMVKVKLATGTAVGETERILGNLEATLASDPSIESVFTLAGGKIWGLYTYEIANEGQLDIQLVPRKDRQESTKEFIQRLRALVAKQSVPGGKIMVAQAKLKGLRKLGEADVEVKLRGQNLEELFALAQETAKIMHASDGLSNVYVSMDMTKPEYQILIDRIRAAALGVSVTDIAQTARALINGAVASRFRDGDDFFNIRVMIPEAKITARTDIEDLILNAPGGRSLRLHDVADVHPGVGPVEIMRENQVKQVVVRADVAGTSVGQALATLGADLEHLRLPPGYQVAYGGEALMMEQMRQSMLTIFCFALFFSFVVLAVQFNSIRQPALILGSTPFCIAGMVFALYATATPVGATLLIGLLVVVASTVNEGVLLLTVVEDLRTHQGRPAGEALIQAAKMRLRPRVMIAAAIVFGFIPLAMNLEEGGEMLQPMAIGAIGGVTLGLGVALFLLPCLYSVFSRPEPTADLSPRESPAAKA